MSFLKFLIDDMCAKFSLESMCDLVRTRVTRGACTVEDVAHEIIQRDHSLDIVSARTLAQAAVETLAESGDVAIQGAHVSPAGRVSGALRGTGSG
ncbi:MAG: hypothetical protein HY331_12955 [Chloroflexi bacterium]|nr:hypothetical protein [Chloroflexota bacterium]